MRCQYREQIYKCGDYLDVQIYPVFKRQSGRGKKAKPTTKVQEKLNQTNAENELNRTAHNNFSINDISLVLTYSDENMPKTLEDAERIVYNFIRRLKRYRKSNKLPDLKYICVTEMSSTGRVHHHLIVNGGVDRDDIEQLWGQGYANSRRLQFNDEGIVDLVKYITKNSRYEEKQKNKKRWSSSRNLVRPQPLERTGRISKRQAKEIAEFTPLDQACAFEELYPEYFFASASPYHNRINNEYYFHVRMYRQDSAHLSGKRKRG